MRLRAVMLVCVAMPAPAWATDVRDAPYRAALDGREDDKARLQAAYDAAPNDGVLTIAGGRWPTTPPFGWGWSPTPNPAKRVMWDVRGSLDAGADANPGAAPITAIGDGDLTERFIGGHLNLAKRILDGTPFPPDLVIQLENHSGDYKPFGYGSGPELPALQIDASSFPGSTGQLNGLQVNLRSGGNNPWSSEEQGINVGVSRTGHNSTWAYSSYSIDTTGRAPDAFATVGSEIDLGANGPDDAASAFDATKGNRIFVFLAGKSYPASVWSAARKVAAGAIVQAVGAGGERAIWVAQNTGETGARPPAWPARGSVRDGAVTWDYGEPFVSTYGRAIWLDGGRISIHGGASEIRYGSGFATDGVFQNAAIDLSLAGMDTPASAAIRLGHDMPIDFTGDGTAAGRNRHVLEYADSLGALVYRVGPTPALVVTAGRLGTSGAVLAAPLATPASSHAPCVAGDREADADFLYVCVAKDTWKRARLTGF